MAGWCMTTGTATGTGCAAYTLARSPIVAESWTGHGEGSGEVMRGFALTAGEVRYVDLNGDTVATRGDRLLPDRLRAVAVEVRGKGRSEGEPFPEMTPLNGHGLPIPTREGRPLNTRSEPIRFSNASHPPAGACRIELEPVAGLVVGGGSVVARLRSYPNLLGRALQACADSSFAFAGMHLLATVLVSAAHPGSRPPQAPAMLPLQGHPGIFHEPEVRGYEALARRIGDAWLVVADGEGFPGSKGASRAQRLTLLEHLRVRVA